MLSEEEEDEEIDRADVGSDNDTDLDMEIDSELFLRQSVVKPLATSLNHVIYNIKKNRFLCSITASESYNRNS